MHMHDILNMHCAVYYCNRDHAWSSILAHFPQNTDIETMDYLPSLVYQLAK